MDPFPFTEEEWDTVRDIGMSVFRASMACDDALAASLRIDLLEVLDNLRAQYGDHPLLLETAADYTDDPAEAAQLYQQAAGVADANGLPTLSIRMSHARKLIIHDQWPGALEQLRACGAEAADGDASERKDWLETLQQAAYEGKDTKQPDGCRLAMHIATEFGFPSLPIRLSLIRYLLDEEQWTSAKQELQACHGELPDADEDDRECWETFLEEANSAESTSVSYRGGIRLSDRERPDDILPAG